MLRRTLFKHLMERKFELWYKFQESFSVGIQMTTSLHSIRHLVAQKHQAITYNKDNQVLGRHMAHQDHDELIHL